MKPVVKGNGEIIKMVRKIMEVREMGMKKGVAGLCIFLAVSLLGILSFPGAGEIQRMELKKRGGSCERSGANNGKQVQ
jgi:hypothetical protein